MATDNNSYRGLAELAQGTADKAAQRNVEAAQTEEQAQPGVFGQIGNMMKKLAGKESSPTEEISEQKVTVQKDNAKAALEAEVAGVVANGAGQAIEKMGPTPNTMAEEALNAAAKFTAVVDLQQKQQQQAMTLQQQEYMRQQEMIEERRKKQEEIDLRKRRKAMLMKKAAAKKSLIKEAINPVPFVEPGSGTASMIINWLFK